MHTDRPRFDYTYTAHIFVYTHIYMHTHSTRMHSGHAHFPQNSRTYILASRQSLRLVLYKPICTAVNIKVIQKPIHVKISKVFNIYKYHIRCFHLFIYVHTKCIGLAHRILIYFLSSLDML